MMRTSFDQTQHVNEIKLNFEMLSIGCSAYCIAHPALPDLLWFNLLFAVLSDSFSYTVLFSLVTRKPVFGVCEQVRLKPA